MKSRLAMIPVLLAAALAGATASAAHIVWNNSGTGNWNVPGNWGGAVPGNGDSAEIGEGAGNGGTAVINTTVDDILYLYLGEAGTETGSLEILPGGSLTTTQLAGNRIGVSGTGNLTITDGTLNISGGGNLGIGWNAGGVGNVTQNGGSVNVDDYFYVGLSGTAHYWLNDGSVSGNRLLIGLHGFSEFFQSGAGSSAHANADLALGWYGDGWGTYDLSDGNVSSSVLYVGLQGVGEFTQTGGTVTTSGSVTVASQWATGFSPSQGTYLLSGPTASLHSGDDLIVAGSGIGLFRQTDGALTVVDDIQLGQSATGQGTYELSGGTVTSRRMEIGVSGTGLFIQTGGTLTTAGSGSDVTVGVNSGSHGTFTVSGTTAQVDVAGNFYVGYSGTGTFRQSGGEMTVGAAVFAPYIATGIASVELHGGHFAATNFFLGWKGVGDFYQDGGQLEVADNIYVTEAVGSQAHYELVGGDVSARRLLVGLHGVGSMTQTGGNVSVLTGAGPDLTIAWYTDGRGTYEIRGGTVAARQFRNGNGGIGLLRIVADGATINSTTYLQNGQSTLETLIGDGGISTINASSSATITTGGAKLDVDLFGGAALTDTKVFDLLRTATAGNISGTFTVIDPEALWSVSQNGTVVAASMAGPGLGPVAADYNGLAELEVGGAGSDSGYVTVTGIDPDRLLWVLLDVEKNGTDLSGTALEDLADYMRSAGHTVFTTHPALDPAYGLTYQYNLAIEFDPSPGASYFAWDLSDFDPNLLVAHVAVGIPEPSSLVLASLGGFLLLGLGWRRRCRTARRPAANFMGS